MDAVIVTCRQCGTKNKIPAVKQHLRPRCGQCKEPLDIASHAIPIELGDADFQRFIESAPYPVLVDFYSPTCGPCRTISPIIDSLARKYFKRLIVTKVDSSRNQMTAMRYQIRGVPTLLFLRNGRIVEQMVGAAPEQMIIRKIETLL